MEAAMMNDEEDDEDKEKDNGHYSLPYRESSVVVNKQCSSFSF